MATEWKVGDQAVCLPVKTGGYLLMPIAHAERIGMKFEPENVVTVTDG